MSVAFGPWNDMKNNQFFTSTGNMFVNSPPIVPEPPSRPPPPPVTLSIKRGVVLRDPSFQAFSPTPVAFTYDSKGVITANEEASSFLEWDGSSGQLIRGPIPFTNKPDSRRAVKLSRDGRRLFASGTNPNDPSLSYDIESGASTALNLGYNFGTSVSLNGKKVVAFSMPIKVWDAVSGNIVTTGPTGLHAEAALSEISADGKKAVTISSDGKVTIWDVDVVDIIGGPFRDHEGAVKAIALSPDSSLLAIGLSTGSVVLMDCESGKIKTTPGEFIGHKDWVKSVAFSPNGKWLCSGSEDGTIRVWDAETGHALAEPARHQGKVWSVGFSMDGSKILSNGEDRTVRVWTVEDSK